MDTNVLVAGACRRRSGLAYQMLRGVLEQTFPIILTEPIALEYLEVLSRPTVRVSTGLSRGQSEDLVSDLVHAAAVIGTYNVRDFGSPGLGRHGWAVMTPGEFLARYL